MIHPPHVSPMEPDGGSRQRDTSTRAEVLVWRCVTKAVVIVLGVVTGFVVAVIIALSTGLIQITC